MGCNRCDPTDVDLPGLIDDEPPERSSIVKMEIARTDENARLAPRKKLKTRASLMMEPEMELPYLHDKILELIFHRLPFPALFQIRCLSKAWQARLLPRSRLHSDEDQLLASYFQKLVKKHCAEWKTYCPITFSKANVNDRTDLTAFNHLSESWETLPSLSFLPPQLLDGIVLIQGTLVVLTLQEHFYVVNILTQDGRRLPSRYPCADERALEPTDQREYVFLEHTLDSYKVIILGRKAGNFVQIYDAASARWSMVNFGEKANFKSFVSAEYVNGFIYFIFEFGYLNTVKVNVAKINDVNRVEELLPLAQVYMSGSTISKTFPVVCDDNMMVLILYMENGMDTVVKIGLEAGQLMEIAAGPPHAPITCQKPPVTDGQYIFAKINYDRSALWRYNVLEHEWTLVPYFSQFARHFPNYDNVPEREWIRSCFRPAVNPFVAV